MFFPDIFPLLFERPSPPENDQRDVQGLDNAGEGEMSQRDLSGKTSPIGLLKE